MARHKREVIYASEKWRIRKCQFRGFEPYYELHRKAWLVWWLECWTIDIAKLMAHAAKIDLLEAEFDAPKGAKP